MLRREISLTAAWALTFGMFAGCMNVRSADGLLEQQAPTARLSSRKLRVLVTDYVPQFGHRVEQAADEILAQSSDPHLRRNALLWKSNAIAACFRAASRPDPFGAYLDVWILTRQMTQFFEQPSAHPVFGPWQARALETSRQLEAPLDGDTRYPGFKRRRSTSGSWTLSRVVIRSRTSTFNANRSPPPLSKTWTNRHAICWT